MFLNFMNFYQHFIMYFSWIFWSLIALLMGGKVGYFSKVFKLTMEICTTFEELKVAFTTTSVF